MRFFTSMRNSRILSGIFLCVFLCALTGCSFFEKKTKRTEPYIVAQPRNWKNLKLYGTEQNVTGFTSDLLFEIAALGDIHIQLISADSHLFSSLLVSGKVDAILTSMEKDSLTEQIYEFTTPYFVTGTVVVVAADSSYKSLDDLKNGLIGYDSSEGIDSTLRASPSWLLQEYPDATSAVEALLNKKIDGVILNLINAARINKNFFKSRIRVLSPPLETQKIYLAVLKGKNHELITTFNAAVAEYVKSGRYQAMLNYWGIEGFTPQ